MGKPGSKPKVKTKVVNKGAGKKSGRRPLTSSQIDATLADAGFKRQRPMTAPYAIKQQRAARDARKISPAPKTGGVDVLRAKSLSGIPWLAHGFSTRQGGVTGEYGGKQLNLGITSEDTRENVAHNRELFARALGAGIDRRLWPLVQMHQVHSPIIHRVCNASDSHPTAGDGLITDVPQVLIAVKIADCIPVIAVDPARRTVGAFHAGWRGTAQRIVEKGIGEMRRHFGSDPKDILVAIGPGIGVCCYQVGDEVLEQFRCQFAYADELIEEVFDSHSLHTKYPLLFLNQRAPGHGELPKVPHLDLVKANRRQAIDAGVPAKNIEALNLCTACRTDIFFSHRKEHVTGRMMAAVGIRG